MKFIHYNSCRVNRNLVQVHSFMVIQVCALTSL